MANGLRVIADYGFTDCPPSDALSLRGVPLGSRRAKVRKRSASCAAMRRGVWSQAYALAG